MLSWKDYYVQEEVRKDRLREANKARLVKSLKHKVGGEAKNAGEQLLEKVGYRLVQWGGSLLRRADRSLVS
jgi:hypothetical protein